MAVSSAPASSSSLPVMAGAARAIPRLCFVPGWTRHLPRIIPVASVGHTVARGLSFPRAGELLVVGNGAPPRKLLFRPATPSFSLPRSNPCRPILIQRLSVADTPSRVDLLKSPPGFTYLNPPSLAYFPDYAFSF